MSSSNNTCDWTQECSAENAFVTAKGEKIRTLRELLDAIESMDEWTFRYHVNGDRNKNDFADWISDTLHVPELAFALEGVLDQKKYSEKMMRFCKGL